VTGPHRPRAVALGGGHGLHASLSALMRLDVDITAVVTVADDGGSSGRIRRELDLLPPGDLRMALAALATATVGTADTSAEATAGDLPWAELLQHRLGGAGALAGHPIGNLLLTGLLELRQDPVQALDDLAALVGARGRVLPMSAAALDLSAEVLSVDPDDPVRSRVIRGQSAIAATAGRVRSISLIPPDAPACGAACDAVLAADLVVLGPGSWFTSVIPHLLVPALAASLATTTARVVTVLNLEPQVGETDGFSPEEHLRVLADYCPALGVDAVIADEASVADPARLRRYTDAIGAQLVLAPVAATGGSARHDPVRLSESIARVVGFDASRAAGDRTYTTPGEIRDLGVH
jgi:uncharacterized cofD-like protein